MENYRINFAGTDGHIVGVYAFWCEDDVQALAITAETADGRPMEHWRQARRVKIYRREFSEAYQHQANP